jgi:hypothetical protein
MSRRLNSCLLIDTTATAHLPGPQNPGMCHLYFAEGCHLYIALTRRCRGIGVKTNFLQFREKHGAAFYRRLFGYRRGVVDVALFDRVVEAERIGNRDVYLLIFILRLQGSCRDPVDFPAEC